MLTDDELRENIRKNLIDLRVKKGLTQLDVAEALGTKMTTVASWEQGLSLPKPQMLYRIAKYYMKTMDYLFEDNLKIEKSSRY